MTISKGLKAMIEFSKSQVSPKAKIEWYKERHIENLATIRLLNRKMKFMQNKIIFLEDRYKKTNNVMPTYQDLKIRVNQILGKKKQRKKNA